MLYSSTPAMMVAALSISGVLAGPTHRHQHLHRKRDAKPDVANVDWDSIDWSALSIDWSSAWNAGKSTTPPTTSATKAPSSTTPEYAASTTPATVSTLTNTKSTVSTSSTDDTAASSSDADDDLTDDIESLFQGLVGLSNNVKSFGEATPDIGTEIGALGVLGFPQASNMMKVSSTDGQDFTNTFINGEDSNITMVLWNKGFSRAVDPTTVDELLAKAEANLGACVALSTPALTFALAPGASQTVAFMDGSIIGYTKAISEQTAAGQIAMTWGEVNYNSTSGCGFDMSAITNPKGNNYNMTITSIETPLCTANPVDNYWLTDTQPIGTSDGSCYVYGTTAHLTTYMAGNI